VIDSEHDPWSDAWVDEAMLPPTIAFDDDVATDLRGPLLDELLAEIVRSACRPVKPNEVAEQASRMLEEAWVAEVSDREIRRLVTDLDADDIRRDRLGRLYSTSVAGSLPVLGGRLRRASLLASRLADLGDS